MHLWRRLLIVFGALPFVPLACSRHEQEFPKLDSADVEIRLGTAGFHTADRRTQLYIRAHNRGADFDGTLEVTGRQLARSQDSTAGKLTDTSVVYRRPLEIARDTTREIAFPVRAEGWKAFEVRFLQQNFNVTFLSPELTVKPARVHLLLVGNALKDARPLAKELEALFDVGEDFSNIEIAYKCEMAATSPQTLPRLAAGYNGFHLVFLDGASFVGASDESIAALGDWVRSGGTLVAFSGPEWDGGVHPDLLDLLGVEPVPGDNRIPDELAGGLPEGHYLHLRPVGETTTIVDGLSYERRVGAGSVTTLAFRPHGNTFPDRGKAPALFDVLAPTCVQALSFTRYPGAALRQVEDHSGQTLEQMCRLDIPSAAAMSAVFGLYILLGLLLPAKIFRNPRRRQWRFAWIVVAAGLVTASIYAYGLAAFGEKQTLPEVSVLRLHADGKGAEATSFVGFFSSGFSRLFVEVEQPAPDAFPQPLRARRKMWSPRDTTRVPPTSIAVQRSGALTLDPVGLQPNELRRYRFDYTLPVQSIVNTRREIHDEAHGHGTVSIENVSADPLAAILVRGTTCYRLGRIEPGAERQVWPHESSIEEYSLIDDRSAFSICAGRALNEAQMEAVWSAWSSQETVTAMLWAISGEVEGLSMYEYQGHRQEMRNRAPVRAGLDRVKPQTLLLVGAQPVFPGAPQGYARKALTMLAIELPPSQE